MADKRSNKEEKRIKINKQYKKIIGIIIVVIVVIVIGLCISKSPNESLDTNVKDENKVLKECIFTQTYKVENILESNDENYLLLTIRQFQVEEALTIRVNKNVLLDEVVEGKNYEFTLKRIKDIKEDTTRDIFDNTEIISIKETDKEGLDQIQESTYMCE